MSSIDERVVQMKFDNSQFQKGVADTNSSLDKLKQGLNLQSSAKSLESLQAAGSRFSLAGISQGVQDLSSKFSALSVIGITALTNITNKALNAGMQFAKSFTVAPIMDGFNEYELKMGSIQTILANTAKDGTSLDQVKTSLEELNKYADKTIYNFGDMTRNIGLFTNAGIGLNDATSMIKGFSNEAAMSGTTSAAAAGAAYQLSQALSKGKVTLEDFKSLTNVGMGNANMKAGLIDIAKAMGTMEKAGVTADQVTKDFNGTLEKGWITTDVMQNYLKIQAGDFNAEQMKSLGLTEDQIANFQKMQKIAEESATKVRTWTQLIGTLKESVGSSWATTFELLLGDFDAATELFTNISNTLGGMIGAVGDKRNELIKGWADSGGRAKLIEGIGAAFNALVSIMRVVGAAWSSVFPPVTVDTLTSMTDKLVGFLKSLQPGEATLNKFSRIFKGLFSILDIGWTTVMMLWGVFQRLFGGLGPASGGLLEIIARFGDFITTLAQTYKNSEKVHAFFVGLTPILKAPGIAINWLIEQLVKLWDSLSNFKVDTGGFSAGMANLKNAIKGLAPTGESVHKVWNGVVELFKKAMDIGKQLGRELGEFFQRLAPALSDGFANINWGTIMGMLGTGLLASIALMIKKFTGGGLIQQIKDAFFGSADDDDGGSFLDNIKETLGGVTDTLAQMQTTLKAATLVAIAAALALMAYSLSKIAQIEPERVVGALAAMTAMMGQLIGAMMLFDRINPTTSIGKLIGLGTAMILLAIAVNILASAVKKLADLNWKELAKGLVGVTVLLGAMALAARIMSTQNGVMIRTGIALIGLAIAIKLLASAVKDFSGLGWGEMARGLIGVGTVLAALTLFTRLVKVNKGAIGAAVGLILLGAALKIMASAVSDFADMDSKKLEQGLGSLAAVLAGLAIFSRAVNPSQMISMGVSMVILGASMKIMASALNDLGSIPWDILGRGLVGLAGALVIIAGATHLMPKDMLIKAASLVVMAHALGMLSDVLKKMGGMSWEEIGKGLVVLAGSLVILAAAMYLMSGGIAGAAALLIMAAALQVFLPVLQALGNMSWEQIWTGIGALALSLLTLGVAGAVLGVLSPLFALLGASLILVGAGALLTGAGLMLMAVGITAIAAAGAIGLTVLVAGVTALLGLIPYGLTQIGLGIVAFAKVIGENVPVFVEAAVKLLLGFIEGLRQVLPALATFVFDMLVMILTTIASNIPKIVQAGFDILMGFLQGIANNIGQVVTVATDVIVNFLNELANNLPRIIEAGVNVIIAFIQGIADQLPSITQAGADLIITFVNSLAESIRNNTQAMNDAGANLAGAIVEGMVSGIGNGINSVITAAQNLAGNALQAAKDFLDINSPSKKFRSLGESTGEGYVDGIDNMEGDVVKASTAMGHAALSTLSNTLAKSRNNLDIDMNLSPTIRPVLDLSSVRKESSLIGGMITPPTLEVGTTYAKASSLAVEARASKESAAVVDNKSEAVPVTGTNMTLVQNNYSPKALSREEIYRQTNNQMSTVKEVLEKK